MTAIGQSLPIAVGLLLATAPVAIVSVVLATKRPLRVSYAFLGGWAAGLLGWCAVVLIAEDALLSPGEPPRWTVWLRVALGAVLLGLGARKWVRRPTAAQETKPPRWMSSLDSLGAAKGCAFGLFLAAANPKNIAIVFAGATTIATATDSVHEQVVALVAFVVVGSLGIAAPTAVRQLLGARADPALSAVDRALTRYSTAIMAAVLMILGVIVVLDGLADL